MDDRKIEELIHEANKLLALKSQILDVNVDRDKDVLKQNIVNFYTGVREIQESFFDTSVLLLTTSYLKRRKCR
jgi:homoserine trans-succinylase